MDEEKFLTLKDLAERFGVAERTLRKHALEGNIPGCVHVPSAGTGAYGQYFVDEEKLGDWKPPSQAVEDVVGDLVGTAELAEYWGVPQQTVQRAAARGSIPGCVNILGKYYFDLEVAVAGWKPVEVRLRESGQHVSGDMMPRGGFAPGNTLSEQRAKGGRVPERTREQYLAIMRDVATPEEWRAVCERALKDAKNGDWRARKWLTDYLIGLPPQTVISDVNVVARKEFELGERAAVVAALLGTVGKGVVEVEVGDGSGVIEGEVIEAEQGGKEPSGRSPLWRLAVDAPPSESSST